MNLRSELADNNNNNNNDNNNNNNNNSELNHLSNQTENKI